MSNAPFNYKLMLNAILLAAIVFPAGLYLVLTNFDPIPNARFIYYVVPGMVFIFDIGAYVFLKHYFGKQSQQDAGSGNPFTIKGGQS